MGIKGKKTSFQGRLRNLSPYIKYINCRNDQLALPFIHLIKEYKGLQDVGSVLLNLWKMYKYYFVKFSVFEKAQKLEGLTPLKILNCATTWWLSYGAATKRIVSRGLVY